MAKRTNSYSAGGDRFAIPMPVPPSPTQSTVPITRLAKPMLTHPISRKVTGPARAKQVQTRNAAKRAAKTKPA